MNGQLALDEARIETIIQQVMTELRQGDRVRHGAAPAPETAAAPPPRAPPPAPVSLAPPRRHPVSYG